MPSPIFLDTYFLRIGPSAASERLASFSPCPGTYNIRIFVTIFPVIFLNCSCY